MLTLTFAVAFIFGAMVGAKYPKYLTWAFDALKSLSKFLKKVVSVVFGPNQ